MTLNYLLVNHDKGTYMYTYKANVIKVVDGDTVDLDIDLGFGIVFKKQRGRLWGINAPESRTRDKEEKKRGLAAKARLIKILKLNNNEVHFTSKEKGKYGRYLVRLFVEKMPTTKRIVLQAGKDYKKEEILETIYYDVNEALVVEGHAVKYFGGKR